MGVVNEEEGVTVEVSWVVERVEVMRGRVVGVKEGVREAVEEVGKEVGKEVGAVTGIVHKSGGN